MTIHREMHPFAKGWRSLADSPWMSFALLTLGSASNIIYAHAPLVALATIAGVTLTRRRAIAVALLIWSVNQAIGFGWRGYPLTGVALTWGGLMAIGTLLVVVIASWRPNFARATLAGHFLWLGIALLGGFILYQGIIVLAFPVLAEGHQMGWGIIGKLFLKQLLWTGAIAVGHAFLLKRTLGHTSSIST